MTKQKAPPTFKKVMLSLQQYVYTVQVAELASLAQLLPPCSPTVRNPAPDSSLKSCFSPIVSASAAAPGPDCGIRFHCCSPFASASSCCSRSRPLRLLLPDCVRFNCCSPIASASTAARPIASASIAVPRLHTGFQPMPRPNVLEHSSRNSRFSK